MDDVVRKVADSWDLEAEKISTEERANDPEARKTFMMLKVLARMAREGKIQESLTRAIDNLFTTTPEGLATQIENFQQRHDVDLMGKLEKIVRIMIAGLHARKPAETNVDDLIRSIFAGK